MLTLLTQKTIAVLHDIAIQEPLGVQNYRIPAQELATILSRLECKKLISRVSDGRVDLITSYCLCHPLAEISLLDVLEAMDQHLNCNRPTTEEFYTRYGKVAQKLGVVNHMTRVYLSEIKMTDC